MIPDLLKLHFAKEIEGITTMIGNPAPDVFCRLTQALHVRRHVLGGTDD
jgi:hypothetical protein